MMNPNLTYKPLVLIFCCWALCAGCSNSATESQSAVTPALEPLASLNQQQEEQKAQAIAARDQLFSSLLGELMSSMMENGPAKSIKVCKTKAPELAARVSEETGVRIGRTSFKLRNQDNAAPEWAAAFVDQRVENEIAVELPDDRLGMLMPIRLQMTCVMCHGSDQQVLPDVKAAIVSNYPDDQATGFAEGDLRGYFWVEVPGKQDSR